MSISFYLSTVAQYSVDSFPEVITVGFPLRQGSANVTLSSQTKGAPKGVRRNLHPRRKVTVNSSAAWGVQHIYKKLKEKLLPFPLTLKRKLQLSK